MNRLLNCQKVRQVFSVALLILLYNFTAQAAPKLSSVEGVIEHLGDIENGYDIKMQGDKRFFNISNAAAMKEEDLNLMKSSYEKKSRVKLNLKDREVVGVESATPVKPAGKVAALGKPTVGGDAPDFSAKTHAGKDFKLADRKGKWTVLYFYPKAETPGCTKQACAFRDSIKVLTALNANVYGISGDSVKDLAAFHKNHSLTFDLLADPDAKVIEQYGAKVPIIKMAKRWTFIIGPDLKIRHIDEGVDPVKDAANVAKKLKELQAAR
jgi:thioredoxin-dependent peroxiredoxin